MLRDTEEHKELSTSTEVEGETAEEKMVRHTQGKPTRQPTQNVSFLIDPMLLEIDLHVGPVCVYSILY